MTRRFVQILLALAPAALPAAVERLGFDPATNAQEAASAYIAPESIVFYRMRLPNGNCYEFEHDFARPHVLRGPAGWKGRITGDDISVVSGPRLEGGRAKFKFRLGRLVEFSQGKNKISFPYETPREATRGGAPVYVGDELSLSLPKDKAHKKAVSIAKGVMAGKWRKSGRLSWPSENPNVNGFLYASAAIFASFFFYMRRRAVKIAGAALFVAAFGATAATASRGALLALAVALAPGFLLHARQLLKSKAFWSVAVLAALVAGCWFATHDTRMFSRGFGKGSWSNEVRLEMWKTAPAMMYEAPDGWGFTHVGRAYMDWHQPLDSISLPGSLMNDHLTRMAGWGDTGRYLYLFAWLAAFSLLGSLALRTKNAAPLGAVLLVAVATWFNPVSTAAVMWILPVATVALAALLRPWRGFRFGRCLSLLAASSALALGVLEIVKAAGAKEAARADVRIAARDGRVMVKASNPKIWIVDDGKALGGLLACKEIRAWYNVDPSAPAVGYVRSVEALPEGKIKRLVLGGKAGAEWMDMVVKKIGGGARIELPGEVVFISPPFPPSALPSDFVEQCNAKIVVGEFAARWQKEYANPPPWAIVVPAMELYIPGWMRFAAGMYVMPGESAGGETEADGDD